MVRTVKRIKKSKKKNSKPKGQASASSAVPSAPPKVWEPGVDEMEDGEELIFDPSAYNYLRLFNIGWPCLSFDVVLDSLGLIRTEFPHTLYGVAGTQAEQSSWNYIGIFKLSNMCGKKRKPIPVLTGDDSESDSSSSDEDEDENDEPTKPVLQLRKVAHQGCVNRTRSMSQMPYICATWADIGNVQVWDMSKYLNELAESEPDASNVDGGLLHHPPVMKFTGHKDEGYALDWSPVAAGRLVSGDCHKCIHFWQPVADKWNVDSSPFIGHAASVEDLQWSPTEADVFASCSVDGTIAIWDTRRGRSAVSSFKAHDADVNVISWNRLASCMIASGSDDGSFSIRDLRMINGDSLVAHFTYHRQPVTSIEWSPHESSTLAVASADHQLTIWDLSLERDEEEEADFRDRMEEQATVPKDLPPQLLFVHQGQKDLKELHWHPQIPGMMVSTSADGFNAFMPSNINTTLPPAGQ